ncbi:NUDIX domain protein [Caballeronia hypogeia]|uniref:NUDIX domain protein n=1 Tax=Caballeronia hypogeia TaxID=1777140 RepID=A0A158CR15_9BURK|nr:NUDIX hydrolase [Caballeronia hypogeia]SAK84306.1 NUDIX domain protein [Caballeronia hypogeia]
MWIITSIGFFSVVQKPGDIAADTLTVRARVRGDLEALRVQYLPRLGPITESRTNDYRFRAVAPRASVTAAMASMIADLQYSNFKSEVAQKQGAERAHVYHDVWHALYELQKSENTGPVIHPRRNDSGGHVEIRKPSTPSALAAWSQADAIACVVPDGEVPAYINGTSTRSESDVPLASEQPETLCEPAFEVPSGYKGAAGVVVREPDGRVWLVAPTNRFGNYDATFPKGTMHEKSAQATALIEAFEESGLRVRLIAHLVDVKRSQSCTRYYLAERVAGNPADMGWESQAVILVPAAKLGDVLNSAYDKPVIEALSKVIA